jgi:hypothetical protein
MQSVALIPINFGISQIVESNCFIKQCETMRMLNEETIADGAALESDFNTSRSSHRETIAYPDGQVRREQNIQQYRASADEIRQQKSETIVVQNPL